jgi:rhodanese-related sulfurtransferase
MRRPRIVILAFLFSAALSFADYHDPAELSRLIEAGQPDHLVVDVRTPEEYAAGHIPTAINIPVTEIGEKPPAVDKAEQIVVYCRSGARSAKAKAILEGLGFTGVTDFGGLSRWTGRLVKE